MSGNKITKVGHIWIANYLKFAAEYYAKDVNIILSAQQPDISSALPPAAGAPKVDAALAQADSLSRIQTLMTDTTILSLNEKLHMLKLYASRHKLGCMQLWQMIAPFLHSTLCFQAVQWAFRLLPSVQDKEAFSELFDLFLRDRVRSKQRHETSVTYDVALQEFSSDSEVTLQHKLPSP